MDPARVTGTPGEQLDQVRNIRDHINKWLLEPSPNTFSYRRIMEP